MPTATTIMPPRRIVRSRCSSSISAFSSALNAAMSAFNSARRAARSALVASSAPDMASASASAVSPACFGGKPALSSLRASFDVSNGTAAIARYVRRRTDNVEIAAAASRLRQSSLAAPFHKFGEKFRRKGLCVRRLHSGDRQSGMKLPRQPLARFLDAAEMSERYQLVAGRGLIAREFARRAVGPFDGLFVSPRGQMGGGDARGKKETERIEWA